MYPKKAYDYSFRLWCGFLTKCSLYNHSHSFDKYLLDTCYIPGTARSEGDIGFNRSDSGPVLSELDRQTQCSISNKDITKDNEWEDPGNHGNVKKGTCP